MDGHLGWFVSAAGDVNGDGFSDVIAGMPGLDAGEPGEGGAFVYLGSPSGLSSAAGWSVHGEEVDARLGEHVSGAGDVNGDGYEDVIVSAPGAAGNVGRASVYLGAATGLSSTPAWTTEGANIPFVWTGAAAGDVNGDGYGDVLVATPWHDGTFQDGELMQVYRGNVGGGTWGIAPRQLQPDLQRPLALLGISDEPESFALRAMFAPRVLSGLDWATTGTQTVFLEWEVKTLKRRFNGRRRSRSAVGIEVDPSDPGQVFVESLEFPRNDGATRWRARFLIEGNPLLRNTRWFSLPGNGISEEKLRNLSEQEAHESL